MSERLRPDGAEAERRQEEDDFPSIIYAIEEPETSQHTENQKQLTRAFLELSQAANTQIIITTHSGVVVKELDFEHIRLISLENDLKKVSPISPRELPYPSLNEVNYLAFSEATEEYHNELYGYIEQEGKLDNFKTDKPLIQYIRLYNNGTTRNEQKTLTEYIVVLGIPGILL